VSKAWFWRKSSGGSSLSISSHGEVRGSYHATAYYVGEISIANCTTEYLKVSQKLHSNFLVQSRSSYLVKVDFQATNQSLCLAGLLSGGVSSQSIELSDNQRLQVVHKLSGTTHDV
jgi:hypothetical protein